jgi:hypothetical protein
VPPTAIVAAAQSCSNALESGHLDEQRLTGDRWVRSEMSDNGHAVDTPLRFFSRDSLMASTMTGEDSCIILARIESVRSFAAVRDGLTAAFGLPFRSERSGTTSWLLPQRRAAQLDPTGSRDRPSVRVAVIHMPENSQ